MKLRIKGNSIRLRLTRPEVGEFRAKKVLEDRIDFGVQSLRYALHVSNGSDVRAMLSENRISVEIPHELANRWTETDEVGFEHHQPLNDGKTLRILVEKDFACLTPREGEDDTGAYPNPNSHC